MFISRWKGKREDKRGKKEEEKYRLERVNIRPLKGIVFSRVHRRSEGHIRMIYFQHFVLTTRYPRFQRIVSSCSAVIVERKWIERLEGEKQQVGKTRAKGPRVRAAGSSRYIPQTVRWRSYHELCFCQVLWYLLRRCQATGWLV